MCRFKKFTQEPSHPQPAVNINKKTVRVLLHWAQDVDVQPISSEEECDDGDKEGLAETLANLVLGLKEIHGRT